MENELLSTLTSCDASLNYLMSYLQEPTPKEPKVIILLNHLIQSYFMQLDKREIKQIYTALTTHKGLNMQQGLLTVMSKLLGRAAYYPLILDVYLAALERGVQFDKQFYM